MCNKSIDIDIVCIIKLSESICTAYKSTVQTEQAMNLNHKFVGPGLNWQQDDYTPVGQ